MNTPSMRSRGKYSLEETHVQQQQLVNNVKHPRQMLFGITGESTLLQLQALASKEPHFLFVDKN